MEFEVVTGWNAQKEEGNDDGERNGEDPNQRPWKQRNSSGRFLRCRVGLDGRFQSLTLAFTHADLVSHSDS